MSFRIPFLEISSESASITILGFGTFILSMIVYLWFKKVNVTKNTVFLSKGFLHCIMFACVSMVLASAFSLSSGKAASSIAISLIIIGVFLFVSAYYTLKVKTMNAESAKRAGMSEEEHYERIVFPSLKLKSITDSRFF